MNSGNNKKMKVAQIGLGRPLGLWISFSGNMVATSQMRQFESEFQFQFIEMKDNYEFSSSDTLATYQVLNGHLRLGVIALESPDMGRSHRHRKSY